MRRRQLKMILAVALAAMPAWGHAAQSVESNGLIQENISTAKITADGARYIIDISILATDLERMFAKTGIEREGVDLGHPGALEREIGGFVARRVTMRDASGAACATKVEHAGEDPGNDEGVLVELRFDCPSANASYDASKLLAVQSSRAWQVVTITRGAAKRQVMVNGDSPPVSALPARTE